MKINILMNIHINFNKYNVELDLNKPGLFNFIPLLANYALYNDYSIVNATEEFIFKNNIQVPF